MGYTRTPPWTTVWRPQVYRIRWRLTLVYNKALDDHLNQGITFIVVSALVGHTWWSSGSGGLSKSSRKKAQSTLFTLVMWDIFFLIHCVFFFPLIYFVWSDTGCDVFCVFEFEVLAPNLFLHYNSKAKVWLHLKGQLHYIQI